MEINEKLCEYLKEKITPFSKVTKSGMVYFTCPNIHKHKTLSKSPTATVVSGTQKIQCIQCNWKGEIYDVVRVLEPDKTLFTNEQITEYIINSLKVDMYSELEFYKGNNWSLVPLAKKSKRPIEGDWTNITHYEKIEWLKWLNNGLNIGLRTGEVSGITVIDYDNKLNATPEEIQKREEIKELLNSSKTLMQNSARGGVHYIFKYDKDIPQTVNIAGLKIDTRNDGGQIVIQPSKFENGSYVWKNINAEIKPISEDLKQKLLGLIDSPVEKTEEITEPISVNEPIQLRNNGLNGCCNDTFTKMGGILINKFNAEQTEFILSLVNRSLLENPMPNQSIRSMIGSLGNYKDREEKTIKQAIYNYAIQQNTFHTRDVVESLFNNDKTRRATADKYLSALEKEGKLIRLHRGFYQCKENIVWQKGGVPDIVEYKYIVPFFNDIATFQDGDVLILGGVPNSGKTTIAMNMVRKMVSQSVEPYYIFSESGSRYQVLANKFGIADKYFWKESLNPLTIELKEKSFTIIDWLDFGKIGFEKAAVVLEYLGTEMRKKGGILAIFTQLKPGSYDWFAPNLIEQYPTLSAKYIQDDIETHSYGHWEVGKIKEAKGNYTSYTLDCTFNHTTKIFEAKSII